MLAELYSNYALGEGSLNLTKVSRLRKKKIYSWDKFFGLHINYLKLDLCFYQSEGK